MVSRKLPVWKIHEANKKANSAFSVENLVLGVRHLCNALSVSDEKFEVTNKTDAGVHKGKPGCGTARKVPSAGS
jgi:hypothetical protein